MKENSNASAQGFNDPMGAKGGVFFRRSKSCPLSGSDAPELDYKNITVLSKFISERGKMMPRRITSISSKKQRELARAIKRARVLALLPFINN